MPFPTESPYDILEITPSAKPNDIIKAYQQAIKKKRHPTAKITQAFNELRNARMRLSHDLFEFCDLGDATQARALFANLPAVNFVADEVASIPIPAAVLCLTAFDASHDFIEPPACKLSLQVSEQYERLAAVLPSLQFPV